MHGPSVFRVFHGQLPLISVALQLKVYLHTNKIEASTNKEIIALQKFQFTTSFLLASQLKNIAMTLITLCGQLTARPAEYGC